METKKCETVGAADKEKTSLHVLNVPLTVFPICMTRTKFPGCTILVSWGTKIFRTKIPMTDLLLIIQGSGSKTTHLHESPPSGHTTSAGRQQVQVQGSSVTQSGTK